MLPRSRRREEFKLLHGVRGIGDALALTILYEVRDIRRFPKVGNFASYCRWVESKRLSNGKRKGKGNAKNGNPYLSWAFGQAAFHARRFQPRARKFHERKLAQRGPIVAARALAHKLCRAVYFMLRDQKRYDPALLFQ